MEKKFLAYCKSLGIDQEQFVLVAVSGGVDSMVLLYLAKTLFSKVAVAHVNFNLRGDDSLQDAIFVRTFCKENHLQYFEKSVDTTTYAATEKLSIQEAARNLRYEWFETLRSELECDHILTAHHFDDRVETFFINLARGAGAAGLGSIPAANVHVKRPLAQFSKAEILAYAKQKSILYRTDSSNESDKYRRNAVRHKVVPALREIFPDFDAGLEKSMQHLRALDEYMQNQARDFLAGYASADGDTLRLPLDQLLAFNRDHPLWYYLFQNYQSNQAQLEQIKDLLKRQPGKKVILQTAVVMRERDHLAVKPIETTAQATPEWLIHNPEGELKLPLFTLKWNLTGRNAKLLFQPEHAFLDASKLVFPLVLRKWKPGDRFRPAGMSGSKKISHFLTDLKIKSADKKEVLVLTSNREICWVVGYRISADFAPDELSEKILHLQICRKAAAEQ